jgi:hypothetical protein
VVRLTLRILPLYPPGNTGAAGAIVGAGAGAGAGTLGVVPGVALFSAIFLFSSVFNYFFFVSTITVL